MTASPAASVRRQVLELVAALIAIAATLPFSPADGSGRQWDNAVLAAVAASAAWRGSRLLPAIPSSARRPWQWLATGAALFAVASLVTATGLSPAFGGLGLGDVLLVLAACVPPAVCAMLATKVTGSRWPTLTIDGLTVTVALLVVADVFYLDPALVPGAVPLPVRTMVFAYGSYAAVAVGLAGALCTVSAAGLRRPASWMVAVTGLMALAAAMLAAALVTPAQGWQAIGDAACVLAMAAGVAAISAATHPVAHRPGTRASSPQVNPAGLAVTIAGLAALPVALVLTVAFHRPLPTSAVLGCATVVTLLLVRMVLRIRDNGRMSEDLVRSEADFRGLVEASSDGVAIVDGEFRLEFTSPAARTLLGIAAGADDHPVLLDLLTEGDRARARTELTAVGEPAPVVHLRVHPADGDPRDLEVTHHERPGSGRRVLHLRDVTVRRRRERELERMAFTDHLTRLPNRALLFQEMAAQTAADGERNLLVLDLDGFKAVNDTAGHEAGDLVLVEVARRLQGVLRSEDLVARLGGDEFAVLIAGDRDAGVDAAQRIIDVLAHPHRLPEGTFPVGTSVGLAPLLPGGGPAAFRDADAALRCAKQAGKGCVRVWTPGAHAGLPLSGDLATALLDGEVQVRYDVATTAGFDRAILHAVPVWEHPSAGLLPAADVWAAAGRQGHTAALQHWLLQRACADAAGFAEPLSVAVDLPAGHTAADDLAGDVLGALAASRLPASRLVLAVTEEALLTAAAGLTAALRELRTTGVRVCLDDYGMGQTLFAHLSRVPLDGVRVDIDALGARGDADRAALIVAAIVGTSRTLGLSTAVHGVDPGPELDAVLAAGATVVHTSAHPHRVTVAELPAAITDLLRRPAAAGKGAAGPAAGSILGR